MSFVSRTWVAILAAVLAVALASCQPAEENRSVESGAKKIAVFRGGEVTEGEVTEFAQQSGLGEIQPNSPEYDAALDQIMPQLVDLEVAQAYASEQGITVTDAEVDQEIQTIKDQIAQQAQASGQNVDPDQAFQQALEQAGISETELRGQIRDQLPVQKVQERVTSDVEPSQEEIQTFYDENQEQFATPEQRCARHILFNKDQQNQAEETANQLQNGEGDFADLAREFSQDPGSAEQGGDLGCLGQGETVPPFNDAIFGAETGEILGPVETEFGFHVIEVTDSRPEATAPLSEVEGQIRGQLTGEQQTAAFSNFLENQRQQRNVRYLEGYEPPPAPETTTESTTETTTGGETTGG